MESAIIIFDTYFQPWKYIWKLLSIDKYAIDFRYDAAEKQFNDKIKNVCIINAHNKKVCIDIGASIKNTKRVQLHLSINFGGILLKRRQKSWKA